MPPVKNLETPTGAASGGDLLSALSGGVTLKKVDHSQVQKAPVEDNFLALMRSAIDSRRTAMEER